MSKQGLENQRNYPEKKKIREFFWGAWFMQANWNSERQMNTAFMYGISPTLDRIYDEPEDLEDKKEAYRRHLEFFNITPQCAALTLGIAAAMEEEYAEHPDTFDPASINAVKVALMGPLSGIGDALFQGAIRTIAMSIGISFAQNGNILGPIITMIISIGTSAPITWYLGKYGYKMGTGFVNSMAENNLMERVMYVCNIVGMFVVGGMVATLSSVTTPIVISGVTSLQDTLDSIVPNLIPLCLTGVMYYIVTKTKFKPMIVMWSCMILGIILNYFGILA